MADDTVTLPGLLDELVAEHDELDRLLSGLDEPAWDRATPAAGWAVRDHVSHLAFFDDAATVALDDPDAFSARARALIERPGDPMQEHLDRGRAQAPAAVLGWWRRARAAMVAGARRVDPSARVPWFGPAMSPLSFVTARLMETWAHGQDVADALGATRVPTARLRHVARLGVRTRDFSYAARGLEPPSAPVSVDLEAPDGSRWRFGEPDAEQSVRGPALDFCLVVSQRRNLADTALVVVGPDAAGWMEIAQCFAGPPGAGRPPKG